MIPLRAFLDGVIDRIRDWWSTIQPPEFVTETLASLGGSWSEGVFGASYNQIGAAAGVIAAALILRGVFARWVLRLVRKAASNTSTRIDDALVEALSEPLKLVFVIIGLDIATRMAGLSETAQAVAQQIIRSLIALAVFWALHRAAGVLRVLLAPMAEILSQSAVDWLVKALQFIFLAVGLAAVLEIWGVRVGPLLAGLGIFGVAVALGAQDLFKNLIAGIAILLEKRFRKGDWIKVDDVVEGVVEEINFRSTVVRRFDDGPVYVPNAKFSDNALTNFSRMNRRRIYWIIGLEYSSSVAQLRRVRDRIEAYLQSSDDFVKPPGASLFVRIDGFNDSSIDIMIYCFTRTTDWGEWLAIKEAFACELKAIVESEGAAFAFPSRSIYVVDPEREGERAVLETSAARSG